MSEIKLQLSEADSLDNEERKELLWTDRQESLVSKWHDLCLKRSDQHEKRAKINKTKNWLLSLLMITIPTILSGVTQMYNQQLIVTVGFITSGLLSGYNTLFSYGKKYHQHAEFSVKYEDFAREMETLMAKPKHNRIACDVFLKYCEMTLNAFTRQAPDI